MFKDVFFEDFFIVELLILEDVVNVVDWLLIVFVERVGYGNED